MSLPPPEIVVAPPPTTLPASARAATGATARAAIRAKAPPTASGARRDRRAGCWGLRMVVSSEWDALKVGGGLVDELAEGGLDCRDEAQDPCHPGGTEQRVQRVRPV